MSYAQISNTLNPIGVIDTDNFSAPEIVAILPAAEGGFSAVRSVFVSGVGGYLEIQSFDTGAQPLAAPVFLSFLANTADSGGIPTVLPLPDGGFFAVWQGLSNEQFRQTFDVYGMRFAADGTPLTGLLTLYDAVPTENVNYFPPSPRCWPMAISP